MIGTELEGHGGMSSVVAAYRTGGLFESCGVTYISPVCEGGWLAKFGAALGALGQFVSLLLMGGVRLVHIHLASGVSFWRKGVFALMAYAFGKPVILHVHGGNFVEFYSTTTLIGQRFIALVFGRASRVIVMSDAWVGRLSGIADPTRCVVIENPVVPPLEEIPFRGDRSPVRFVFLGRLEEDKGVFDLIEAFSLLVIAIPEVHLVMGGVGELAVCRKLADKLRLGNKVEFPGWVVGTQKAHLLRDADVFVLPSHIEALPIAMLEAMSFGLPMVICPVGSIPETVRDQVEAIFVPVHGVTALAEAMKKLATNAVLRHEMGRRGVVTFSERFSVHSVVPRVVKLYQEVLNAP